MAEKKGLLNLLGFGSIVENFKGLVDTKIKILKLEIKDELANAMSKILIGVVLINLLFFALLLLSIALSIYLGEILNNYYLGFIGTGGIYIVLFIFLLVFKEKLGLKEAIEKELNRVLDSNKRDKE